MSGSMSFDNLSSLSLMRTSESFSDLNAELSGGAATTAAKAPVRSALGSLRSAAVTSTVGPSYNNYNTAQTTSPATTDECNNNNSSNKPFGLGEFDYLT